MQEKELRHRIRKDLRRLDTRILGLERAIANGDDAKAAAWYCALRRRYVRLVQDCAELELMPRPANFAEAIARRPELAKNPDFYSYDPRRRVEDVRAQLMPAVFALRDHAGKYAHLPLEYGLGADR